VSPSQLCASCCNHKGLTTMPARAAASHMGPSSDTAAVILVPMWLLGEVVMVTTRYR
jgi:hypothetical protein